MGDIVKQFNKAMRAKRVQKRWIAAFLCLSILAGLGTVSALTVTGQAATYKDKVLDCRYVPPSGPGYADFAAHTHNDDCYDGDMLVCPLPEIQAHYHDESCYADVKSLVCGLEENDGHVHDENCYSAPEGEPFCGLEESDGHQHDENCFTAVRGELICGLEEGEEHTHSGECYAWTEELICGMEEGAGAHRHSEACGLTAPELICGKEIGEGAHYHNESCYETRRVLSCGLQGLHVHSDSCYNENGELICGQLHLEAHVHGEACFKLVERDEKDRLNKKENDSELPLPEDNYFEDGMAESDPTADVEYAEIWDAMFAELALSGSWADDLLQVAASQLGYRESTSNFMLGARREMKGYTRYGAWYGIPYGDWCAMFVSFCLNYADIPEAYMPRHCSCQSWVELLEERSQFGSAAFTQPQPGDLIFYDFDHDDWADHVGLVFAVDGESGRLTTLEGNRSNNVALYELGMEDPSILGYGALPENPYDVPYSQAVKLENEREAADENDTANTDMPARLFREVAGEILVTVDAPEGAFPAGTTMTVKPVNIDEVMTVVSEAVDSEIRKAEAVDISFYYQNEEIQPAAPVTVSLSSKTMETSDNALVVHVDHDGSAETVESAEIKDDVVSFDTPAFSIYTIVYTVDFTYDGLEFSIPGDGVITLSELFQTLGIEQSAAEVKELVFSNPQLVEVIGMYDDWLLRSLMPFNSRETLTATFANGRHIVIDVTDEQHVSDNIAEALYDVEIKGATREMIGGQEVYQIKQGETYSIDLKFREVQNGIQFPMAMDSRFTYQLPAGLNAAGQSGSLDSEDGAYSVLYSVGDDGRTITFEWKVRDAEKFQKVVSSNSVRINLEIEGVFDENVETLKFNDTITKHIHQDDDHNVTVSKNASYDYAAHKMKYGITVKSDGANEGVVIQDRFDSGNVFALNHDVSLNGSAVDNVSYSGNGFTINVGHMGHGETRTYEYTADLDQALISQIENGEIKIDQTGNTVTVTSRTDQHPDDNEATAKFSNNIKVSSLDKSAATIIPAGEDGYSTIEWTIKANEEKLVKVGSITDKIDPASRDLIEYSGTGIHVVVEKEDGTRETRDIEWNSNDLVLNTADQTWTYRPPESDGKAKYEITYTTRGNGNDIITKTDAKNIVDTHYNHTEKTVPIEPNPNNDINLQKRASQYDLAQRTLDWEITFQVPKKGLESATVTDTLPAFWSIAAKYCPDVVDQTSITVEGLDEATEHYTMRVVTNSNDATSTDPEKLVFEFGKLFGGDEVRTITIRFHTTLNQDWLDEVMKATHTNQVELVTGNDKATTEASVEVDQTEPELKKTFMQRDDQGVYVFNGWGDLDTYNVPAFVYQLDLLGVSDKAFSEDGFLEVTDSFDAQYLQLFDGIWTTDYVPGSGQVLATTNQGYATQFGQVYGIINNAEKASSTAAVESEAGKITFKIDKLTIPRREDGTYYPSYRMKYVLVVPDKETLNQLQQDSLKNYGGKVSLPNTAVWGPLSDEVSVDFTTPVVTKNILNADAVRNGKTDTASYKITINPDGVMLGTESYLTVTDTYSNQSVDYEQVTFDPADAVIEMSHSGYSMTMIIKNGMPVTITYPARVLASGEYSNTVSVFGQEVKKTDTASITSHGGTGYNNVSMRIMKYAGDNMLERLPGAVFELYEKGNDGFVKIGEYTTGPDGMINLSEVTHADGSKSDLYRGVTYKLVEITAPDGYKTIDYDPLFTIITEEEENLPDVELYTKPDWKYLNHDVLTIAESPDDDDGMWVKVHKEWSGVGEEEMPESITIKLIRKQNRPDPNSSGTVVQTAKLTKANKAADGSWEYMFTGLEKGYAYAIEEEAIPGFETVYENLNTLGLISSGRLSLTNEQRKITLEKHWEGGEPDLRSIDVRLLKDGVFYQTVKLEKEKGWKAELDELPWPAVYTVEEPAVDGYEKIGLVYVDADGNLADQLSGSGTVTITNRKTPPNPQNTSVKVEKVWQDSSGTPLDLDAVNQNLTARIELIRYRQKISTTRIHFWNVNGTEWTDYLVTIDVPKATDLTLHFTAGKHVQGGALKELNKGQAAHELSFIQGTEFGGTSISLVLDTSAVNDLYIVTRYTNGPLAVLSGIGYDGDYTPVSSGSGENSGPERDKEFETQYRELNYNNYWSATFGNLPAKDDTYSYTYAIKELEGSGFELVGYDGYEPAAIDEGYAIPAESGGTVKVTNKLTDEQTGSLALTKMVAEGGEKDRKFSFTVTFSGDDAAAMARKTYPATLSSQQDAPADITVNENLQATVELKDGETLTVTGLPLGVKYSVAETGNENYEASYKVNQEKKSEAVGVISETASEVTVTNTRVYKLDVAVKKINNSGTPLDGAVFELYQLKNGDEEKASHDSFTWLNENDQFTVGKDGFTMTELTDGTWQIREVHAPEGYVITESEPVTFKIADGAIVSDANVLKNGATYTAATETDKDTFSVVNTAGQELPEAGGIGTHAFTALGAALLVGAALGYALVERARRRKPGQDRA